MKICHVTSAHDSNDVRILNKECVSLAKKENNDVYLIARGGSYEYKGVQVIGVGEIPAGRIKRILKGTKIVFEKAMSLDADIYHLHDPELLLYAKKFAQNGKKVIFDSHELYYMQILEKNYLPKFVRKFIADLYYFIECRACHYLSGAVFPCEIKGTHPFADRVKNCVYLDNVPLIDEGMSNENFEMNSSIEPTVCCIGSLTRERGIQQLIQACYKANVKLVLGGDFSPTEFEEEMKNSKEFETVDYKGFCSRKQVMEIYRQSTIGASTILPIGQYPIAGNLPTKVYEFMMHGLPFIISDFPYNKKMIKEWQCGIFVNPYDVGEIAEAICYLINNPDVAKIMGEKGRVAIEEKFNWTIEEKELYNLYEMVMKEEQ